MGTALVVSTVIDWQFLELGTDVFDDALAVSCRDYLVFVRVKKKERKI